MTDHATLEQAVAGLAGYPRLVRAAAHASLAALGPWMVEVNCSTGSGIVGTREAVSFEYEVDFAGFRTNVRAAFDGVIADVEAFWPEFAQLQEWMTTELTEVAGRLESATGGAPEGIDAAHRHVVESLGMLAGAEQAIHDLLGKLNRYPARLKSAMEQLADESTGMFRNFLGMLNEQPCGKDDALVQFISHTAQLTRSMGAIAGALATMRQKTVEAQHHVAHLRTWLEHLRVELVAAGAGAGGEFLSGAEEPTGVARHASIAAALRDKVSARSAPLTGTPFHDDDDG